MFSGCPSAYVCVRTCIRPCQRRSNGVGRVDKIQGALECSAPELKAKNAKKSNFPVTVKIRTSGYQTLECFIAIFAT